MMTELAARIRFALAAALVATVALFVLLQIVKAPQPVIDYRARLDRFCHDVVIELDAAHVAPEVIEPARAAYC